MAFFRPERYFSRLSHVGIQRDLLAKGFTHVLLDVDNTLLTRDTHTIPRDVGLWLARARDAGIVFCLLSNNWHSNVRELAASLDLPIVDHAVKPLPPAFLMARRKAGGTRKDTVVIGDQLVTDVLGAHFLGMTAYMLAPLVQQDLPHTLLLRNVERAIMGDRQPEGALAPELAAQLDLAEGLQPATAGSAPSGAACPGALAASPSAGDPACADRARGEAGAA